MDPFSWIGAISGVLQITQVISQTAIGLSKLKGKFDNADLTIQCLIGELATIKSAVTHLEDWARFNVRDTTESEEYIEGLNVALDGCRAVMEHLGDEVTSLTQTVTGQATVIGFRARVKVIWNEDVMRGHQERLHAQVVALQLLLQACQCRYSRSSSEQVELLRRAENRQIIQKVAYDTATLRGSSYAGSRVLSSNWSFYQPSISQAAADVDRTFAESPSFHRPLPHLRSKSESWSSASQKGDYERDTDEGYASGATASPSLSQTNSVSLPIRSYNSMILGNGHSKSMTYGSAPGRQLSQTQVQRSHSSTNPPLSPQSPLGSKRGSVVRSMLRRFSRSNLTSSALSSPARSLTASKTTRAMSKKDLEPSIDLASPEGAAAPMIVKLAQSGSRPDVEMLIESGHGVDSRHFSTRRTALLVAAHCGHESVVDLLIQKRARLDVVDAGGSTALHLAASRGHCNVLRLLLEHSMTEVCDAHGRTALWVAAHRGQLEALRLLIANHARVNVRADNHMTALHTAAKRGDEAIIELLIACGADIEAKDGAMMTALHYACEEGHLGAIRLLLDGKATIDALGSDRRTPLICAAAMGRFAATQELLKRKASVRSGDDASMTALHWAAFNGHTEVVELLSRKKGALAECNKLGRTALHLAAMNSRFAVVESLLRMSIPVETRCLDGLTPLHYACLANNLEIVRLLLISDADVEAQTDTDQRRPVHIAAAHGSMGLLNLLIDKGASLEARDSMGDRALGVACRYGHAAAVQNLLGRGCPLYLKFGDKSQEDSPLCLAAMGGHLPVVSLLLQHGASVVKKDGFGWQPHHYAAYNAHPDILALLLSHGPVSASDGTEFGQDASRIGFAPHAGISEEQKEQIRGLLHRDGTQLEGQTQNMTFQGTQPIVGTCNDTPGVPSIHVQAQPTHSSTAISAVAPQELPVTLEQGLPASRSATPEHMRRGGALDSGRIGNPGDSSQMISFEPVGAQSDGGFPPSFYSMPYWRGTPVSAVHKREAEVEVLAPEPTGGPTSRSPNPRFTSFVTTFDAVNSAGDLASDTDSESSSSVYTAPES
ncbi:ankyrin repeat protein [Aspergillus clavatus NRRL 1]|uniref:Ankyrin repeat domain protein n=1 Tax=Aspergillus clavatus (strain ATCC 1007 / CBS 513.65 / DSM 816 / NCTC 3887 / NRRL 1 / QM 1276 / 107) TaxID=344612 RepID=A1CM38_ASPCL|nr:ankyrin repeat domain protein [Aspergillus clavatus NRRL 1]EAW08625.1 ankyrin repeat domain protein [Aspergillus clavatus NRRL 1]